MLKKIALLVLLLLVITIGKVVDTTTIVRIYQVDDLEFIDYIQDGELFKKVYIEDLTSNC